MRNDLDIDTKQHILDEFSKNNKRSIQCRVAAVAVFIVSLQLMLHRDGFLWWLFFPGFMVTAVLVLMAGIYRHERSVCPFCGVSLGYKASKTDYVPRSCPKCGEKL